MFLPAALDEVPVRSRAVPVHNQNGSVIGAVETFKEPRPQPKVPTERFDPGYRLCHTAHGFLMTRSSAMVMRSFARRFCVYFVLAGLLTTAAISQRDARDSNESSADISQDG